jgi:hypothetical protein
VAVVDLRSGRIDAFLEFLTAVEEIFDVQLLPGLRFPEVIGFQQETIQHTFVVPPVLRAPEGRWRFRSPPRSALGSRWPTLSQWRLDRLSGCRTIFAADRLSPSARQRFRATKREGERAEPGIPQLAGSPRRVLPPDRHHAEAFVADDVPV